MATKKEINEQLKIALNEVGTIEPWYDKAMQAWIFEHPAYPVGYSGDSREEVIKNYPLHLKEFIKERLKGNLAPFIEKQTKGKGGLRAGAGRPKGSKGIPTKQIRIPVDIADWLKTPGMIMHIRELLMAYHPKTSSKAHS
jgi:hypothetical protein